TVNFMATVSLSLSKTTLSVTQGATATATVTISGGTQSVSLSTSTPPSGITFSYATNPLTDSPTGVQTSLTVSASSAAPLGTYPISITATGADGQSSTSSVTLTLSTSGIILSYSTAQSGHYLAISVSASAPTGIQRVEWWLGNKLMRTSYSSP